MANNITWSRGDLITSNNLNEMVNNTAENTDAIAYLVNAVGDTSDYSDDDLISRMNKAEDDIGGLVKMLTASTNEITSIDQYISDKIDERIVDYGSSSVNDVTAVHAAEAATFQQAIINTTNTAIKTALTVIFPVGSIMATVGNNPTHTEWDYYWIPYDDARGKFLLNNSSDYNIGATGGSKTADVFLPKHKHAFTYTDPKPLAISLTKKEKQLAKGASYDRVTGVTITAKPSTTTKYSGNPVFFTKTSNGTTVAETPSGIVELGEYQATEKNASNQSSTSNVSAENGFKQVINTVPPYIVVQFWKRVSKSDYDSYRSSST